METLIPSARIERTVTSSPLTSLIPPSPTSGRTEKLNIIDNKLTTIIDILKESLTLEKKAEKSRLKKQQMQRRSARENKLEAKVSDESGEDRSISLPGKDLFSGIKEFFLKILGAYLVVKFADQLPKLVSLYTTLVKVGAWIFDWSGRLLEGLVTIVDWGYKAYDWTKGQVKDIFGDKAAEDFDKLSSNLNKVLNAAIIAAMAASNIKIDKPVKVIKPTAPKPSKPSVSKRIASKPFKPKPTKALSPFALEQARKATTSKLVSPTVSSTARPGALKVLKNAMKPFKGAIKRIPVIGTLIDFALNYFIFKEPLGRAAFKAIGAGLLTAIGTAAGGPLGMIIGGMAGDYLGGIVYDAIFTNKRGEIKKPIRAHFRKGPKGNSAYDAAMIEYESKVARNIPKLNDGGIVKKQKSNIEVRPNPSDYEKGKQTISPIKINDPKLDKVYGKQINAFNDVDYFGPILATAAKMSAGENLVSSDFDSIGAGINNLMLQGFKDKLFERNLAIAMNEGGVVSADTLSDQQQASDKFSNWVSKKYESGYRKNIAKINQSIETPGKEKYATGMNAVEVIMNSILSSLGIFPAADDSKPLAPQTSFLPGVSLKSSGQATGAADYDGGTVSSMGFANDDWNLFRNTIAQIESSGRYNISGGSGNHYDGRYQLGAAAKTDGARYAGISDPGHTPAARERFRNDPELQEKIFAGFTKANHTYLMGVPEYRDSNPQRKLQILGYAHNQGMGGAERWMKTGVVGADGFGTKGTKYTDSIAAEFRKRSQNMQFGGQVDGREGLDVIPAMLTKGEHVIDRDSAQAIRRVYPNFLDSINKAEGREAVEVLMDYASYYDPSSESEIVIVEKTKVIGSMSSNSSSKPSISSPGGSNSILESFYSG